MAPRALHRVDVLGLGVPVSGLVRGDARGVGFGPGPGPRVSTRGSARPDIYTGTARGGAHSDEGEQQGASDE